MVVADLEYMAYEPKVIKRKAYLMFPIALWLTWLTLLQM